MDKERLAAWLDEGLSLEAIAARVRKHPSTVGYWVAKHGLRSSHTERHAAKGALSKEHLEALVARDLTVREIAAEVSRSTATVRHWLKRHGLETTREARRKAKRTASEGDRFEAVCAAHGRTHFVVRKDGTTACLRCRAEAVTRWRRNVKRRLVAEAGGACTRCGYDRNVSALHFHHIDPASKRFGLGGRGLARAWADLKEEAAKCVLLCANCHAEVEAEAYALR